MAVELYKTAVTFLTDNETQIYISINLLLDHSCDSSNVLFLFNSNNTKDQILLKYIYLIHS